LRCRRYGKIDVGLFAAGSQYFLRSVTIAFAYDGDGVSVSVSVKGEGRLPRKQGEEGVGEREGRSVQKLAPVIVRPDLIKDEKND
jgi:hypothetical protein